MGVTDLPQTSWRTGMTLLMFRNRDGKKVSWSEMGYLETEKNQDMEEGDKCDILWQWS